MLSKSNKPQSHSIPSYAERSKRIIKKTPRNFVTPSIKDALQGKFNDNREDISAAERFRMHNKREESESFTKEDLKNKWKEFLVRLDDRPNLKSTLSKMPELQNEWQLHLEIDNSIQNDLINSIKPELVSFLRRELKNSKIEFITKVTKEVKNKIIYTDMDKFDEMVKKNPSLKTLKQKFNLDFGEI